MQTQPEQPKHREEFYLVNLHNTKLHCLHQTASSGVTLPSCGTLGFSALVSLHCYWQQCDCHDPWDGSCFWFCKLCYYTWIWSSVVFLSVRFDSWVLRGGFVRWFYLRPCLCVINLIKLYFSAMMLIRLSWFLPLQCSCVLCSVCFFVSVFTWVHLPVLLWQLSFISCFEFYFLLCDCLDYFHPCLVSFWFPASN